MELSGAFSYNNLLNCWAFSSKHDDDDDDDDDSEGVPDTGQQDMQGLFVFVEVSAGLVCQAQAPQTGHAAQHLIHCIRPVTVKNRIRQQIDSINQSIN